MANPKPGTLFLFIHGLSVIRQGTNHVEVVLPRVPGHAVKGGSWLNETPIERRRLTLQGVKSGSASFFSTKYMIRLRGSSLTSNRRASTLMLPQPKRILELLLVDFPPSLVTTRRPPSVAFPREASLQVLIYDYDDENEVFLERHYWEPVSTEGAISLHIISTSEGPVGRDHEDDTAKVLRRVLDPYPGLEFRKPAPIPPAWRDATSERYGIPMDLDGDAVGFKAEDEFIVTDQSVFAFAQAELEPIGGRTERLGRLGRMKQQRRPLGSLWHEAEPLGEYPCNCGGILVP